VCNKIKNRIECQKCGYPYSEARWPDYDTEPLPCDISDFEVGAYIQFVKNMQEIADNKD
jgi:hypothetical protein